MGLFEDPDVHNVKFFIQKDISPVIVASLTEIIQVEGGRVEQKVPIKGYVLIQPDTAEAQRLREAWATPDRPDRHFVPVSWVEACREAGRILKPIFVHANGDPVKICIHNSISNVNSRQTLAMQIIHSGGNPMVTQDEADVILADKDTEVFKELLKHYASDPAKHIESHLWVKKCIDKGTVFHGAGYKPTGGRRTGDERTAFTEDDERNLCAWIASVIPYKESGGRTGNKIYQELVSRASEPNFAWVSRHTWQSWRERYKKNAVRLDQHIAAIVDLQQPLRGMKPNPYGYQDVEYKPKKPRRRGRKDKEEDESADAPQMYMMAGPSNANVILDGSRLDQQNEWAIRVGHDQPPEWAKRSHDESEEADEAPYKRNRPSQLPGTMTMHGMPFHETALHPIDQAIQDIANECHFLAPEVRAFYDLTGDMNATRERFKKLRDMINNYPL